MHSISNLATTYMNQGQWKEAKELQVLVMEMMKWVLGEEHPHSLKSMANLALVSGTRASGKRLRSCRC